MKPSTLLPLIALLPLSLSAAQNTAEAPVAEAATAEQQPALTPKERELFTRWNNGHLHIRTPRWWNEEPRSLFSSRLIMEHDHPQAYEQRIATLSEDGMTLTLLTRRADIGKAGFTYTKEVRRAMALKGLNNDTAAPYTFVRELSTPGEVEVEHWQLDPATRDLLRVTRSRFNLYDLHSMEQAPEQVAWEKPAPYSEAGSPLVRIEQRHDPKDVDHWPDPARDPKYAVSPDGKHMVYAFENATGAIQYHFDILTREGDAWVQEPQEGSICTRWCGLDYELTDEGIIGIMVDDELELALTTFIPYTTGGSMSYRTTYEDRLTPLVEAAASGDEATVRALLTSPKVDAGAVNCRGIEAFMVASTPEIILLVRERQGFNYDYGKALDAAITKWKAFDGKYDSLTNGFPENYVRDLLRAKQSYLAERSERLMPKLTLPSIEEENLFQGWDLWRHSETPQWDAKRRAMYTTKLRTDADGRQVYSEAVQQLSEDGMQLTLIFRRGVCGTAGFIYEKDVLHAKEPYIFDLNKGVQVIWRLAPDNDLQEVVMHRVPPSTSEETDQQLWKKPEPYSAEKAPLVTFRNLVDGKLMESAEPDPTGNPRYTTSPDGKHLVLAHENGSGAWSYIFTIYTREGDAWVQEPQQKFFGSRACPLDFFLTDEGISGILQDEELQLYLPLFIPYTGSEDGLWYRGERAGYAYPLHDAAREGQVEVVRALLTSLLIDPCELNSCGEDATMVTDNEEIIALIRAAQGPDYDYGKALDAAIKHWSLVAEGKRSDPRAIAPAEVLQHLHQAKEKLLTEQE